MEYIICTDSCCDLSPQYLDENGVRHLSLMYTLGGVTYEDDNYRIRTPQEFYGKLRQGQQSKTTLINSERYTAFFEDFLSRGQDVLYLGFSSGLSGSLQSAMIAQSQLIEKYPDRHLVIVDTLCASMGQGLLVHYALRNRQEGMGLAENARWLENHKLNLAHWFTVDDLNHLRRGGRVSATSAILGTVLSIKPVLHVDNEGRLIAMSKVRGRKQSLKALVDHFAQTATDPASQDVFISHGDCLDDARYVGEMIAERFSVRSVTYHEIGPVIGSHSGPGTVALFFMASER